MSRIQSHGVARLLQLLIAPTNIATPFSPSAISAHATLPGNPAYAMRAGKSIRPGHLRFAHPSANPLAVLTSTHLQRVKQ